MPRKRTQTPDPTRVVSEFLDNVIDALQDGHLTVREHTGKRFPGLGGETTGYECRFRGISVHIAKENQEVRLDGTLIGPEVVNNPKHGTHLSRCTLLWAAFAERHVMQEADSESARRTEEERRQADKRVDAYAGLAAHILAQAPKQKRDRSFKKR